MKNLLDEALSDTARFADLLLPIKQLYDYKGMASRILKTFTLGGWSPRSINGYEVWRSVG